MPFSRTNFLDSNAVHFIINNVMKIQMASFDGRRSQRSLARMIPRKYLILKFFWWIELNSNSAFTKYACPHKITAQSPSSYCYYGAVSDQLGLRRSQTLSEIYYLPLRQSLMLSLTDLKGVIGIKWRTGDPSLSTCLHKGRIKLHYINNVCM